MTKIRTDPQSIWTEYTKGTEYLSNAGTYEEVKINENFYIGKQWEGVKADGMPKPVLNILQRVVKYLISVIGTNDVAISITPFTEIEDDIKQMEPVTKEIDNIIETARLKEASRQMIRNAAVDGSCYMLQMFNPEKESGQAVKGAIENMLVDNTQVYFGNPYDNDIQSQPYIIIALRQYVGHVKAEAEKNGVSKDLIDSITADNDGTQANENDATDLVTVLMKFYKMRKTEKRIDVEYDELGNEHQVEAEETVTTVWFTKTTKDVVLIKPVDLEYKRYPISCFGWDEIKNSYLYKSPLTAVIPNQVFINKCYAIAMQYGQQSAFPKVVYDRNKVDIDRFLNGTSPQAVTGIDMMGKFLDFIKVPDFSNNILALIQDIMQQTKECMGVNDASLGNVKPDNTSAIVALQEGANVPLEIQKQQFYWMWEDTIRNILDIMSVCYGVRQVMSDEMGLTYVDFSMLQDMNYNLKVDIGNGSQFSEVAQISTLDKLFQNGLIDPKTYIESIPQKYLTNKGKILKALQEQEQLQQQQMMAQQQLLPPVQQ